MVILNTIIITVCSMLLITLSLLRMPSNNKSMFFAVPSVFIITSGCDVIEKTLSVSWVISFGVSLIYLAILFGFAKVIERGNRNRSH